MVDLIQQYVPTVFMRGAEFQALGALPSSQKDLLTPIFHLKPFMNSKLLENSLEKIDNAFGARPFFLDLDPYYVVKDLTRNADYSFAQLRDSADAHQNWVDYIVDLPNALPCLQVAGVSSDELVEQAEKFSDLGKPFIVKILRGMGSGPNSILSELLDRVEHSNYAILLDRGYDRDILSGFEWASGILHIIRQRRGDDITCIITGSSFPRDFSGFMGSSPGTVGILERTLFDQVHLRFPTMSLIYGDWASSRPPSEGGGAKPYVRVDLPTPTSWRIYRHPTEYPSDADRDLQRAHAASFYSEVCRWVLKDPDFLKEVDLWGYQQVIATAESTSGPIQTPYAATATRINIHLFRQAHHEQSLLPTEMDDPFIE